MTCMDRSPNEAGAAAEPWWELRSEGHVDEFFAAALQLRGQELLVDTTVTLGLKNYEAHSILLAAVSSVFLQRLERAQKGPVELDGVTSPAAWEAILNFAYTGELEPSPDVAGEILDAAEALGAPRVVEICMTVMGTENRDTLSPGEEKWKTLQRLEELYNDGIGWDLELKAEGDTFRVHRLALACGCEFFRGMFTSGMRESQQAHSPICTRFTAVDLKLVISFAYSGLLQGGWDYIFDAAQAALQYQVSGIWALCLNLFHDKLTPESSLDILSFARAYSLQDLENTAYGFILKNFAHIIKTAKFLDLPINQLVDFLSSDSLYILNELEAFQGVIRWLDTDRVDRMKHAEKLLHCIRFPLMSTRELKQVRKEEIMASPGRLYNLMVNSLASIPPGPSKMEQLPCRKRYPEKVIVISGGDTLTKNMATRSPSQDFWFAHRFLSGIGLVKQIEWRHLGKLPEKPRFRHAVAVKDNIMYLFGGKHYYGVRDTMCTVFRFDPLCGSWERLADMTSGRSYFPVIFLNGFFYALGGSSNDVYCLDSVECYELQSNTWRPCAPLPAPVCGHAACVLDKSIYISGGSDGSCCCQTSLLQYRPDAPPVLLSPMMEERAGHVMEVLDGRIYVAGGLRWRDGHGGYTDQLTCEVYHPNQDVWVALSPLPQAHVTAASAVLQGELYILGGYSHNTYRDTHLVHCYNPIRNLWVNVGTLPQAYVDLRACILELPLSLRRNKPSSSEAPSLDISTEPLRDLPYQNSRSTC